MIHDVKADTPEILKAFEMSYQAFVDEVERFDIDSDTMLVGHSMGGGFWVRYLSEHPELSVNKVVLVAPWLDLDNEYGTDFFDFQIDHAIADRAREFVIFSSDNDLESVQDTVRFLQEELSSAVVRTFHNYGHFTIDDMKTDVFPELLYVLL